MYEKILYAGWGDMDFNSHMRNTAFLDKSGDVRMMFFAENGFPMTEFMRLRIGPVVLQDKIDYYKEISLLSQIKVRLLLTGLSGDGSKFILRNEFYGADGKIAADVTSSGGWLDLLERKLIAPPEALFSALNKLSKSSDFKALKSFNK
ncbi:MAG: thioesterase [Desulfobacteraceae bacterium]|nr:thioesterase [Desulfobacteraceae bacterium]